MKSESFFLSLINKSHRVKVLIVLVNWKHAKNFCGPEFHL